MYNLEVIHRPVTALSLVSRYRFKHDSNATNANGLFCNRQWVLLVDWLLEPWEVQSLPLQWVRSSRIVMLWTIC